MRDLDTISDNLLLDGAEPAGTWNDYRHILKDNGARQAELEQFDRVTRRGFLTAVGKGALALGVFGAGPMAAGQGLFGRGLVPSAWENIQDSGLPKPDMIIHAQDPFNGELPVHLLDDPVTPTGRHFVRNNGGIPERARTKDLQGWTLRVDGEVHGAALHAAVESQGLPRQRHSPGSRSGIPVISILVHMD